MKAVLIFFICVYLFGCHSSKERIGNEIRFVYSSFPEHKNLKSEKYVFDSVLNPNKIHAKNGLLILSENGRDKVIHLIDQSKMKYVRSLGKKGDAPGEFRSTVREFDLGFNDSTVWAYDLNAKTFFEYSLSGDGTTAINSIKQKGDFFMGMSMHWIGSNEIISYLTNNPFKLGVFDTIGNNIRNFGPWSVDKEISTVEGYILSDLHQGQTDVDAENERLVHAALKFDYFEIFDLESGGSFIVRGPVGDVLDYKVESAGGQVAAFVNPETIRGYNDVFLGKESIFLVFNGKTDIQMRQPGAEISRTIFQFDFEGNPLAHFKLDVPIKAITVSEKDRKIYAVTQDREPGIAVFNY